MDFNQCIQTDHVFIVISSLLLARLAFRRRMVNAKDKDRVSACFGKITLEFNSFDFL